MLPEKRAPRRPRTSRADRNRLRHYGVSAAAATATAAAMALTPFSPTPAAQAADPPNRGVGYDLFYDFPGTLNPFSFANAILQTAVQVGLFANSAVCGACTDLIGNLEYRPHPQGGYIMVQEYNNLLYPLRAPEIATTLLAAMTNVDLSGLPVVGGIPRALTSIANAYEPAVDILINIGYDDVDTTTWQRSFDQFGTSRLFILGHPLGPLEYLSALYAASSSAAGATASLIQPILADLANALGSIFGIAASPLTTVAPAQSTEPASRAASAEQQKSAPPEPSAPLPDSTAPQSLTAPIGHDPQAAPAEQSRQLTDASAASTSAPVVPASSADASGDFSIEQAEDPSSSDTRTTGSRHHQAADNQPCDSLPGEHADGDGRDDAETGAETQGPDVGLAPGDRTETAGGTGDTPPSAGPAEKHTIAAAPSSGGGDSDDSDHPPAESPSA